MAHTSRRRFLGTSALAAGAWWTAPLRTRADDVGANEKLNIAVIGPGGRGYENVKGVRGENIVAICEVDDVRGAKPLEEFSRATRYTDYRRLLDKEAKNLDAVVISTPDHVHVPAALNAMRRGLHCYCEKPLSHTVREARLAAEVAAEHGVVTQMGTQIHAGDNYRRVVEIVQSGQLGEIDEVHVWVNAQWGGGDRPAEKPPVPKTLDWNAWLGPAPARPYHSTYVPFYWRRWWDFGSGSLGDMGCHYIDLVFWSLGLTAPTRIAAAGPEPHAETAPLGMTAEWSFPAVGDRGPVTLRWADGDRVPKEKFGEKVPGAGVIFVGSKGKLYANYGSWKWIGEPPEGFEVPEPTIAKSIGHHAEWIEACKTGGTTTCHFGYAGPLTETVLLGTVAHRIGEPLEWDAEKLEVTNVGRANDLIDKEYRKGWGIDA